MIKAPCLFYEIIISREMHNNWYISQNTTKKMAVYKHSDIILPIYARHVNGLSCHFAPNANILYEYTKSHTKIGKKAEPCFYHLSIPPPLELFPFYHYPHRAIRFFVKIFLAGPPMILLPWQGRPRHIAKAPLAKQFLLLAVFQTFR